VIVKRNRKRQLYKALV